LRNVLPACLLALTDRAAAPADVVISAPQDGQAAVLAVTLRTTAGPAGFPGDAPYRLLEWSEVQALAAAEGIALAHDALSVRLTFPTP
jgi:hypothetical protein